MKKQSELKELLELTERHKELMDSQNIIIQVYVNASGFLWQASKLDSGTDLGWCEYTGDCELSGAFTSYNKALKNALDLIAKADLEKFKRDTPNNKFHWGNYIDYLQKLP